MASLMKMPRNQLRLLDPGAGIGSLTAAVVDRVLSMQTPCKSVSVVAWELDNEIIPLLLRTMRRCHEECRNQNITFSYIIIPEDFTETGSQAVFDLEAGNESFSFNRAILNPPYRKITSESAERLALRHIKIEASNLYAGFVALTIRLLEKDGELVAITPRSFCNGPYFKSFRTLFLKHMRFRHIHTFNRRDRAFADDGVLQENIIFYAAKNIQDQKEVVITHSEDPSSDIAPKSVVSHEDIVSLSDIERVFHIPNNDDDKTYRLAVAQNAIHLSELGISVSTGRVVDFRVKQYLRELPNKQTVPLIYPFHFQNGYVVWPKPHLKKPNSIVKNSVTLPMLMSTGYYVLVKRFSSKEERRRIVAVVFAPSFTDAEKVAFENHVNVYHVRESGMSEILAKGISAYLNTTMVDKYFRQFSGHTQVNAADLRMLTYPTINVLERIGSKIGQNYPCQNELDELVKRELQNGASNS